MNRRRWLAFLTAGAAVLVATTGTGGFTGVTADREIAVSVVDDERAYLGVETHDRTVTAGQPKTVTLLTLENRLRTPLTAVAASVKADENGPPVPQSVDAPGGIGPGADGAVTVRVNCDAGAGNPTTEEWTVAVEASGPDVAIELERTIAVTCEGQPTAEADTNGTATPGTPSPTATAE